MPTEALKIAQSANCMQFPRVCPHNFQCIPWFKYLYVKTTPPSLTAVALAKVARRPSIHPHLHSPTITSPTLSSLQCSEILYCLRQAVLQWDFGFPFEELLCERHIQLSPLRIIRRENFIFTSFFLNHGIHGMLKYDSFYFHSRIMSKIAYVSSSYINPTICLPPFSVYSVYSVV